ncbi:hypothetical protein LTSEMIN_0376, partial [Salmonella enterica subsp. enterica serovar Minnesota str. A4-603]
MIVRGELEAAKRYAVEHVGWRIAVSGGELAFQRDNSYKRCSSY